jgi:ATP-dependent RNA helicase RhlE
MRFSDLGLAEEIVRAVTDHGYTSPTPIQTQAIPAVLSGGDLLAGAQTGTGKTAGFVLPILQRLSDGSVKGPSSGQAPIRTLILTPTRELAAQVEESVRIYGKYTQISSMVLFGGVGINPQIQRLRSRVDILVATPGRLLDHVQQGTVNLSGVQILVLDEADRMLDMGFIKDIKRVLALLPKTRQNLLFSATFSDEIKALADGLLNKPALIEVARRNATADNIAQKVYFVDRDKKRQVLTHLIKTSQWFQVLVFTRTKHGANRLAEQLGTDGIPALAIHGNKSQTARTRALAEFKQGGLQVLVATDIAARGIDINELPHVVNYELPNVPEDYIHRIGRTGRAGAEGEAISLMCVDEVDFLRNIERLIKRQLPKEVVPGFEPTPNVKPQPIQLRSQQNPRMDADRRAASQRAFSRTRNPAQANQGKASPSGNASPRPQSSSAKSSSAKPRGQAWR